MKARQTVLLLAAILVWLAFGAVPVVRGDNVFLDDFAEDNNSSRFVIEAEHYSSRSSSADAGWWEVDGRDHKFIEGPVNGQEAPTAKRPAIDSKDTSIEAADKKQKARGNYMVIMGILSYSIAPTDSSYGGAFIDYKVAVEKPGTYRLYARWLGQDLNTDSLFAFILKPDGTIPKGAGPDYFIFHQFKGGWYWDNRGVGGTPYSSTAGSPDTAVWRIKEPGVYTIRVAQRENRTALDTLVFQTIDLPSPADSELAESRLVDKPIENKEVIAVRARLQEALEERRAAMQTIDAAIKRETLLYQSLEDLLASGKYGDLSRWNVSEAKQKVSRMIASEEQSREVLRQAIEELLGALRALGWRPPPPPQMVAYWKFDDGQGTTANDSAGRNNGTVHGAEWTAGRFNNALSFDGVDDYVEVPDDPSLRFMRSSSFTISAWVMPVLETENGYIICKMRSGGRRSDSEIRSLGTSSESKPRVHTITPLDQIGDFEVWRSGTSSETTSRTPQRGVSVFGYLATWNSKISGFSFGVESSWKGYVLVQTGRNSAPFGSWYHVVGVYDDKDVRIYLNGELRGRRTFDLETGSTTPDKNLVIGAKSYDSTINAFFGGKIDEVRIYDGALSDAEIWALYGNGSQR
ncbi:MAG: hypothetical protein OEW48_11680 [Phycisphaerae bacterium]|nr:hypothetical protein [Phycisphaerae bacterium]